MWTFVLLLATALIFYYLGREEQKGINDTLKVENQVLRSEIAQIKTKGV